MNRTGTASRTKRLAHDLALSQLLVLVLVLLGEVLERFGPTLPEMEGPAALISRPGAFKWFGLAIGLALNLLFLWTQRRSRAERESDARNATIDRLYAELHRLTSQPVPGADSEIEQRLARLRALQEEEAAAMRQRYEASSPLKPGTGWQALNEARRLLSENENPPSSNPTLQRPA
ncbi:MAG TPA: hypothetical protein VH394_19980 [Thermoanaerobaculia bacterium]|jgi:hypothetical protein|nr:hypothetical protein [Thermoanaerobaculia bacterium]